MKIYIGPYRDWIGPYQIAEKILFWMDKGKDDRVHKFGEFLAGKDDHDTWLTKFCNWIHSKKKRNVKVRIDKYDTWSMDGTLAYIILPMLKQLRDTKHGAPYVDNVDVPEALRSTNDPTPREDWDTDKFFFDRWDYVLNEIIWAFEQMHPDCDWEDQYHTGKMDIKWIDHEDGTSEMAKGPNDTHKFDIEGYKAHSARIDAGLKLFGKYYRGLWD